MGIQHQNGVTFSDLDSSDPVAILKEFAATRKTKKAVVDNKAGKTQKHFIIKFWGQGSGPFNMPDDVVDAGEIINVDLSSLGVAAVRFEIHWEVSGTAVWHKLGLSAAPGEYFKTFGIRWDANDSAHPVVVSSS